LLVDVLKLDASDGGTVFVMDLFSNFVYRYSSVMTPSHMHMAGDSTTITDSSFRAILEQTFPILGAHPNAPKSSCQHHPDICSMVVAKTRITLAT
jgi:hypothetical protein